MAQSFKGDIDLGILPELDERDDPELFRELVRIRRAVRLLADLVSQQKTTSVGSAAFTVNAGIAVNTASTFDGYTVAQVVKALRELEILK